MKEYPMGMQGNLILLTFCACSYCDLTCADSDKKKHLNQSSIQDIQSLHVCARV